MPLEAIFCRCPYGMLCFCSLHLPSIDAPRGCLFADVPLECYVFIAFSSQAWMPLEAVYLQMSLWNAMFL